MNRHLKCFNTRTRSVGYRIRWLILEEFYNQQILTSVLSTMHLQMRQFKISFVAARIYTHERPFLICLTCRSNDCWSHSRHSPHILWQHKEYEFILHLSIHPLRLCNVNSTNKKMCMNFLKSSADFLNTNLSCLGHESIHIQKG